MIRITPRAIRVQLAIRNILAKTSLLLEGTSAASSNEMMRVCFYMALFTYDSFFFFRTGNMICLWMITIYCRSWHSLIRLQKCQNQKSVWLLCTCISLWKLHLSTDMVYFAGNQNTTCCHTWPEYGHVCGWHYLQQLSHHHLSIQICSSFRIQLWLTRVPHLWHFQCQWVVRVDLGPFEFLF